MALVACIECGSQVSDKAAVCPKCGITNPSGKKQEGLVVVRRNSCLAQCLVSVDIQIDRVLVGKLSNGAEIKKAIAVGRHELTIAYAGLNRGFQLNEIGREGGNGCVFEVENGRTTLIEFNMKFTGVQIVNVNLQ